MPAAISAILTKVLQGILVWGLERFYVWVKNQHAQMKDDKETSKAAKSYKKANDVIVDKIDKAEEITNEDVKEARKAAHDLISRLGHK